MTDPLLPPDPRGAPGAGRRAGRAPRLALALAAGLSAAAVVVAAGTVLTRVPGAGPVAVPASTAPATSPPATSPPAVGSTGSGSSASDRGRQGLPPAAAVPGDAASEWAISALLAQRAAALVAGDRAGFLATSVPESAAAAAARFARVRSLPIARWDYDVVDLARSHVLGESATGAYDVAVRVSYRLAGVDDAPVVITEHVGVALRGDRWQVVAESSTGDRRQPWDFGRVQVVRGPRSLVLGVGGIPPGLLADYASLAESALRGVTAVWGGGWDRRATLVVPRTSGQLAALLGRTEASLEQIAAVATAEGRDGITGADRVWVNRPTLGTLTPLGREIVLRHELLHVAAGAARETATPLWLEEALAEYVGYLGSGVPVRVAAADVLASVRAGRAPERLPTPEDFSAARGTLAESYEGSWLAARLVAERWGRPALLAFYREVAADPAGEAEANVDVVLRSRFGLSRAAFVAQWRDYLERAATTGGEAAA